MGYAEFLFPGLVMMSMVQNAFANTSSSLVIAKIQGNIVDLLMPPLSPLELAVGLAGGGLTRGICVGLVSTWRSRCCCRSMSMTGSSSSFTPSARR